MRQYIEYLSHRKDFHFNRVQINVEKNPLFREQMVDVKKSIENRMRKISLHLKNSRSHESLGANFLKDEYSVLEKLKAINKSISKFTGRERPRRDTLTTPLEDGRKLSNLSHRSSGGKSTESKTAMKKRRETAVKKMMLKRMSSIDNIFKSRTGSRAGSQPSMGSDNSFCDYERLSRGSNDACKND